MSMCWRDSIREINKRTRLARGPAQRKARFPEALVRKQRRCVRRMVWRRIDRSRRFSVETRQNVCL